MVGPRDIMHHCGLVVNRGAMRAVAAQHALQEQLNLRLATQKQAEELH